MIGSWIVDIYDNTLGLGDNCVILQYIYIYIYIYIKIEICMILQYNFFCKLYDYINATLMVKVLVLW